MHPKKGKLMAKFEFNCENLEKRMNEGQNINVSGLSLNVEIEISELPQLIKEIPSVISAFSNASEKAEARHWEKLCDEKNAAEEKRREAEAKLEAAEHRLQRKQDEVEELRKKFFVTPAEK